MGDADRRHAQGRAAAAGPAAGAALRPSPANLFVADVHRLAGDEPLPRPARRRRRSCSATSACRCRRARSRATARARRVPRARARASASGPSTSSTRRRSTATLPRLRGRGALHRDAAAGAARPRDVQAPPVVTDDVLEIAKDVDAAAVERLEELEEEQFVLACARFDSSDPTPDRGAFEFAVRRRPPALLRPLDRRGRPVRDGVLARCWSQRDRHADADASPRTSERTRTPASARSGCGSTSSSATASTASGSRRSGSPTTSSRPRARRSARPACASRT